VLGIETSCDDTACAVVDGTGAVLASAVSSQLQAHRPYGGVVPEIASREHLQHLFPLVTRAVSDAGAKLEDVEAIAVTSGPGLIGALLVGVAGAQGISYGLGIPLVAVNHLEGHIFSPYLQREGPSIPLPERFLSLVISGGHSSIYDVRGGRPAMLNRTRDDAIGETFDKVAKFIGLPYPGGPEIDRLAAQGAIDRARFPFAMPRFHEESTDFSYSGIKAGAIRLAREHSISVDGDPKALADFCATFQEALIAQLFDRLSAIWRQLQQSGEPMPSEVAIAGGVAANGALRKRIVVWGGEHGVSVRLPERRYCTDNAAMIAFAALQKPELRTDPRRVPARSRIA